MGRLSVVAPRRAAIWWLAAAVLLVAGAVWSSSLAFAESPAGSLANAAGQPVMTVASSQAATGEAPVAPNPASWQGPPDPSPRALAMPEDSAVAGVEELASRYSAAPQWPRPLLARQDFSYFSGQPLTVQFNVALTDFSYYVSPPAFTRSWIDQRDHHLARLDFLDYEQGQTYDLYLTSAKTEDGQQTDQVYHVRVSTPPALTVTETAPEDGSIGIGLDARPVIAFSEAIANRAAAEQAISVDPPTRLVYVWTDDTHVQLSPAGNWPYETAVTVSVLGGASSVVGVSGGFLAEPVRFQFTTRPNKTIDVDLTKQVLTLYDGDQAVFTSPTATGVRGAETPTGDFSVQYKLEKTRMRGVNPSGSRYDIPNVPWVLAFWGDYTIHGAPWRQAFGTPQSNGCVSLPVPASKFVYDWAPVGTLIHIHY